MAPLGTAGIGQESIIFIFITFIKNISLPTLAPIALL